MKQILFILILVSMTYAKYVPDHSINWDELVPLIRIGIPFLIVVGAPVIITVIIVTVGQLLKYLGKWTAGLATDITSKEDDDDE